MEDASTPKAVLYERFAVISKALANPARLLLLELLAQGERTVDELGKVAGMRRSNTSAQLTTLASAGLVIGRRDGPRVFYRLADDQVAVFTEQLKDFAHDRLAEVERAARDYLGDVDALDPMAIGDLSRKISDGEVLVLDVRPAAEYAAGHIPGALNIPLDELADRLAELPPQADVVAYCRGRYCVLAPKAARLLRDRGFGARLLDGGLPEWRHAGHAVTVGAGTTTRAEDPSRGQP